ncbi:hypothetical protein [Parabacteroides sp. AF48-14]|uniref:hypothetical protein n=1 Tax=Parabacteroides sp. AF48-14 TaxID=2292052 RepID=UPI001F45AACE|nr:hypothetical protein [Parabacteroides sp. AF48-14]
MYTIGIDLGGTFVKIGLVESGKVLNFKVLPAHSEKGLRNNLPEIKDTINLWKRRIKRDKCLRNACQ